MEKGFLFRWLGGEREAPAQRPEPGEREEELPACVAPALAFLEFCQKVPCTGWLVSAPALFGVVLRNRALGEQIAGGAPIGPRAAEHLGGTVWLARFSDLPLELALYKGMQEYPMVYIRTASCSPGERRARLDAIRRACRERGWEELPILQLANGQRT